MQTFDKLITNQNNQGWKFNQIGRGTGILHRYTINKRLDSVSIAVI